MPRIIVTSRFLKGGTSVKRGNLVKYIATRETVEIYTPQQSALPATDGQVQFINELLNEFPEEKGSLEYEDYNVNPTRGNATELISELLERNADRIADREIFVRYIAERPGVEKLGKHGLFSSDNNEIRLADAMKKVAQHDGNVWTHVVSLNRADAERLGYTSPEMWRSVVMKNLAVIAEAQRIDLEKLRWYAAFHNTAHHPHIHLIVYSDVPKQGYLTNEGIEKIRSAFANTIFVDELNQIYEQQTAVRNTLRSDAAALMESLTAELRNGGEISPQLETLIIKLSRQLANSKGKKVYGYLQPKVKETVNEIVRELAKNPSLKKMYAEWCRLEQEKYASYTNAVKKFPPLEENKVFKPIKNSVIRAVLNMDISPELETPMPSIAPDEIEEIYDEPQENITAESYHMNWRGDYKTACGLMYDGDYANALALFQEEADKGNVPAIYNIAKMYQRGQLGEENIPKAQEYYARTLKGFLHLESSAGKMQPYVWYHIGKLYDIGYGTEQNYTEAFRWFQKAAISGNHYAQYSLGSLYHYGNGTEQDYEKAFEWYKKSADKHNAYACYEAAKMLRDGIGTEQNPEQSDKYFREAYRGFLKMDNKNADDKLLYRLGAMTLKGIGCTAYPEKAAEYFRRSAEMNNKYALCEYGKMLTEGDVISQDAQRGIAMLKRSAELGNSTASYALGKIYLFGKGVERDTDLAREWLTISAEAGNEYAMHLLENMDRFYQTAVQNAAFTMLKAFGRLVSADYKRISRGQKYHTEHKLKTAIRRKKEALGIKESHTDYPNY